MFRLLLFFLLIFLIVSTTYLAFETLDTSDIKGTTRPVANYRGAVDRIGRVQARDGAEILPDCRSLFLSHGKKTDRVLVYLHGLTNCPLQFAGLAETFYKLGYNVFIPRLPFHGIENAGPHALEDLTANALIAAGNEAVDIAQGLGDTTIVVGLSMGGTVTGWLAQHRPEVDRAIMIAPLFGLRAIPGPLTEGFASTSLSMPDIEVFWDPIKGADWDGPAHVYPQFSTHVIAEILRLGVSIRDEAYFTVPEADSVLFVLNDNDPSVDNQAAEELFNAWADAGATNVGVYRIDASLGLGHDLIDQTQPFAKIDVAYPLLLDLIDGRPFATDSLPTYN